MLLFTINSSVCICTAASTLLTVDYITVMHILKSNDIMFSNITVDQLAILDVKSYVKS